MIVVPQVSRPPIIIPAPIPVPRVNTHSEVGTESTPIQEPTKGDKIFTFTVITILVVLMVWLIIELFRDILEG